MFSIDWTKTIFYFINTSEIPGELSRVNISSHVKITRCFTSENNVFFLKLRDYHCYMVA